MERLLGAARALTLVGPGGVGKSRLALEMAGRTSQPYPDGVCFVELASLADPALVPRTIAHALGLQENPGLPPLDHLQDSLRDRRMLLILDNCEHLLAACCQLMERITQACPGVVVLATTREPLRAPGETAWQVPPLSTSAGAAGKGTEAMQLFAERARTKLPSFEVIPDNASAVDEVCRRLDGIPLAIELAAARSNVLTPQQLAAHLDERLSILTHGSPVAPARHQTLRALIDWSHSLLSEAEQRLFRRLAVFAGGSVLPGVQAVCSGDGLAREDILDLLSGLVDKSLLTASPRAGEMCYLPLETVHQYAWEKLREAGEEERCRRRHLDWFAALADRWRDEWPGPNSISWLERVEARVDNFRAAIEEAGREPDQLPAGLQLTADLFWFWLGSGRVSEGQQHLAELLAAPRLDTDAAPEMLRARLWALVTTGTLCIYRTDLTQSRVYLETALTLAERLDDTRAKGRALTFLGVVLTYLGDLAGARSHCLQGLAVGRELEDGITVYFALHSLAQVHQFEGDFAQAVELDSQGLALARQWNEGGLMGVSLQRLAQSTLRAGDVEAAAAAFRESVARVNDWAGKINAPYAFDGLACVAAACGQAERAWRLRGAAAALRKAIGAGLNPTETAEIDRWLEPARSALSAAGAERAWQAGYEMFSDEAIQYALQPEAPGGAPRAARLTARQAEVLRLLAAGRSNHEIAAALMLSVRTVERHIDSVYQKLDVHSRVEAAAYAIVSGLAQPNVGSYIPSTGGAPKLGTELGTYTDVRQRHRT